MKIRYGLVLATALGLGTAGCASGGSSGPLTTGGITGTGAELLTQGERPQETADTRAAQRALGDAEGADGPATARVLYEEALTAARAGIAALPMNPLAHRLAALSLLGLERYQEASAAFDRAGELRPIYELEDTPIRERAWISLYQEAAPLVNEGDYEAAAELFVEANFIYDGRPEAMITLGQIYAQFGRHEESLANLDRAVEIISSMAEERDSATVANWHDQAEGIPFTRAQVLAEWGAFAESEGRAEEARARLGEAAAAFRAIADEDPSSVEALKNLAALRIRLDDFPSAFAVYEELMGHADLSSLDFYQIGVGFYQGEDNVRAARAFASAAERSPQDRDAVEMWARSLQEDSVWVEVPPAAERWIELDPYNRIAYMVLAQARVQTGDTTGATEILGRIETLEVWVDNLQLTRFASGGAQVTGTMQNQTLEAGTPVTFQFTFYDEAGNPLGTVDQTVNAGAEGMSELFRLEFTSADQVGGYGYTLAVG